MAPLPDYHWCPGQFFDPGWGNNWDQGRCHDDGFFDGEPRDGDHWRGNGPWNGGGTGPGTTAARVGTTADPDGTTTAPVDRAGTTTASFLTQVATSACRMNL